jgi:hypothetical protein
MAVFCSSLILCFAGMLLKCFLDCFEIVPVVPIATGVTLGFYSSHALYFYSKVFYFKILVSLLRLQHYYYYYYYHHHHHHHPLDVTGFTDVIANPVNNNPRGLRNTRTMQQVLRIDLL